MKLLSLAIALVYASVVCGQSQFIKELMSKMTVEDKCGQMTQITFGAIQTEPAPTNPDEIPINVEKLVYAIKDKRVGSILNTPYNTAQKATTWQAIIKKIQDIALNENLQIPILYGLDSIHGANYIRESTLFPQPISMAASFNVEIAKQVARITAEETRAVGVPWNFNPVLDVGRQPLWPRYSFLILETFFSNHNT